MSKRKVTSERCERLNAHSLQPVTILSSISALSFCPNSNFSTPTSAYKLDSCYVSQTGLLVYFYLTKDILE